jgi:molybdopterin-guanine dinucleotide biosynthesis protein A
MPPRAGALGIVLAGGEGRRLGGVVPKALARCAGRTLLERAVDTLAATCGRIVVAAPAALALPGCAAERAADAGGGGPLAGVIGGWRADPTCAAVVLGVDFPLARAAALAALLERLGSSDAVLPSPGGRLQPLFAVYAPAALATLEASFASGERSITRAAAGLTGPRPGDAELAALPGGLDNFFNVNTPEDLAEAARRLS